VLEYQEVSRIGSNEVIKVNVRLLSATHRDLEAAIAAGQFRRDLFHRLNRLTVRLPALRERAGDLPELAAYFAGRAALGGGRPAPALGDEALALLRGHDWPGNLRELQNVVCRAVRVCRGPQILPAHLDLPGRRAAGPAAEPSAEAALAGLNAAIRWAWQAHAEKLWPRLRDLLERELLRFALAELGGNQTQVADRLEMARGTVIKRLQEYGLK
jgi:DNA-binding NtrC family response regulator